MSLGVLNNIAAIYAQNNLDQTQSSLQNVLQQLSSGSRINSGADDAAGLAVADGLHANEAALNQSSQNASSGVGLLQTADGALSQVTNLLNRAVTLATEASNGTLNASQVSSANQEYQNILTEIGNIGSTTNFNGNSVFSNEAKGVFVSDGTSSGATTFNETVGALTTSSMGTSNAIAATSVAAPTAPTASAAAAQSSSTIAFTAGTDAVSGTLQLAVGNGSQHSIALTGTASGMAALINGDSTFASEGITATFAGTTLTIKGPANGSGTLLYGASNNVSDAGTAVTPSVPTTATTGQSTSTIALANSDSLSGTLSIAVGAGTTHAITVAAGTSGADLAAQINADATYQTNGVTAAYNATTGSLSITGPTGAGKNLSMSGTALTDTGSTGVDLSTAGGGVLSSTSAQAILTSVTSAIQDIDYQRGNIGASVNELNAASNVASAESVNLTSAEDSIRSTNYGQATSDMAKYQVLSQTGISALAQANTAQQEILKLMQ